jgi:hypothetical protein
MISIREAGLSLGLQEEGMTLPKLSIAFRTVALTRFILLEVMVLRKVLL